MYKKDKRLTLSRQSKWGINHILDTNYSSAYYKLLPDFFTGTTVSACFNDHRYTLFKYNTAMLPELSFTDNRSTFYFKKERRLPQTR